MNTSLKNYLGIAGIIGILLAGWSLWTLAAAFSSSIEPTSFRSFEVTAEGKVVAIPDVAQFSFSVLTEGGTDLAALQKSNTTKINKAIAYVKSKGVAAKDIKTESYRVEPRYQNYSCEPVSIQGLGRACGPAEIVGYTIQQSVGVKVRDFETIGDLLTGIVGNGANTVSQLTFGVDDPTALQDQARSEAIDKAQSKARNIAEAGGFRLGRLLGISESSYIPMLGRVYEMMGAPVAKDGMAVPTIEPGSQEITANITLRYEIK